MRAVSLAALAAALCFATTTDSTKSHDKAYNAIISRYYTTDPFFMVKKRSADNRRQEGGEGVASGVSSHHPRQIPAPLLVGGGASAESKEKGGNKIPIRMHIKKKKKKNVIKAKKVLRKKTPKLIRDGQKKRQVFSELLSYSGEVGTTEAAPRKEVIAQVRDFALPGQLGVVKPNNNNFDDNVEGEIIRNRPLGNIPEGGSIPELLGPTDNSVFPGQPGAPPRKTYFDIMDDFFDTPEINIFPPGGPPRPPPPRTPRPAGLNKHPSYSGPPPTRPVPAAFAQSVPGVGTPFFEAHKFNPKTNSSPPPPPRYAEPLAHFNPLDTLHKEEDVESFKVPPPNRPPPSPPRTKHGKDVFSAQVPGFIDVPKLGSSAQPRPLDLPLLPETSGSPSFATTDLGLPEAKEHFGPIPFSQLQIDGSLLPKEHRGFGEASGPVIEMLPFAQPLTQAEEPVEFRESLKHDPPIVHAALPPPPSPKHLPVDNKPPPPTEYFEPSPPEYKDPPPPKYSPPPPEYYHEPPKAAPPPAKNYGPNYEYHLVQQQHYDPEPIEYHPKHLEPETPKYQPPPTPPSPPANLPKLPPPPQMYSDEAPSYYTPPKTTSYHGPSYGHRHNTQSDHLRDRPDFAAPSSFADNFNSPLEDFSFTESDVPPLQPSGQTSLPSRPRGRPPPSPSSSFIDNNLIEDYDDGFVMPQLPPPPELILATRNFPVDVPRLGAKVPYKPLEMLVHKAFHGTPDLFQPDAMVQPQVGIRSSEHFNRFGNDLVPQQRDGGQPPQIIEPNFMRSQRPPRHFPLPKPQHESRQRSQQQHKLERERQFMKKHQKERQLNRYQTEQQQQQQQQQQQHHQQQQRQQQHLSGQVQAYASEPKTQPQVLRPDPAFDFYNFKSEEMMSRPEKVQKEEKKKKKYGPQTEKKVLKYNANKNNVLTDFKEVDFEPLYSDIDPYTHKVKKEEEYKEFRPSPRVIPPSREEAKLPDPEDFFRGLERPADFESDLDTFSAPPPPPASVQPAATTTARSVTVDEYSPVMRTLSRFSADLPLFVRAVGQVPSMDFDQFESVANGEETFGRRKGVSRRKVLTTRSAEARSDGMDEAIPTTEQQEEVVVMDPKSLTPSNSLPPSTSSHRSFDYGRSIHYHQENKGLDDQIPMEQPHQFANVVGHDEFSAGHNRGNPHHHTQGAQHRGGHRHREEVSWHDAYSGHGNHYFELNHVDKNSAYKDKN